MSVERDSDRKLRTWLSEGVDRAPEQFVWGALDEIERLPQRPAWRPMVEGWTKRLRPTAAVLGAAAVLLIAVAVVVRLAPNLGIGGPLGQLGVSDLQGIVVWEDTMPAGWTLDNLATNPQQVRALPLRSLSNEEIEALLADSSRYLGGRYTDFSGPDSIFISWALVFERDIDAVGAMPLYDNEMAASEGWGLGPGTSVDLGDVGFVYEGETTRLMGEPGEPVPMRLYLWRHGNVLLALGGWFTYDTATMDRVAAGMDARTAAARTAR